MHRMVTYLAALSLGGMVAVPQSSATISVYVGTLAMERPSYGKLAAHSSKHRRTIRVTGTITDGGVECTALQGDDGQLYTLAGVDGGFGPGDRVRVIGRVAGVSFCMQGTTIEVRRIVAVQ